MPTRGKNCRGRVGRCRRGGDDGAAPAARVLTTRELNRALLARQLLLERAAAPPGRGGRAGVRAADAARAVGLHRDVVAGGRVPAGRSHRGARAGGGRAGLGHAQHHPHGRRRRTTCRSPRRSGPPGARSGCGRRSGRPGWTCPPSPRPCAGTSADGPLSQPRLVALLAADGFPKVAWAGAQLWVDLLRVPPAGTWDKPRAHLFALAEHVVSSAPVASADDPRPSDPVVDAARELLVTRYLRAFGPASPADVASFTGLPITVVRAVLARCDLRHFRDEAGGELVDVPDAPASRRRARPRRCASWAPGTPRCSCTPGAPSCCPRPTARASSRRRCRVRCRRSSSTARWPAPGPTPMGRSWLSPFHDLPSPRRDRAVAAEAERLAAFHTASD